MTKILATADIPSEELGLAPRALRGEVFEVADEEASALISAGLAVVADSPDSPLHRDARVALAGKRDG